jgi:hypothetical protein
MSTKNSPASPAPPGAAKPSLPAAPTFPAQRSIVGTPAANASAAELAHERDAFYAGLFRSYGCTFAPPQV